MAAHSTAWGAGCAHASRPAAAAADADGLPGEPGCRSAEHCLPGDAGNGAEPRFEHAGHGHAHDDVQASASVSVCTAAQPGDGQAGGAARGDQQHERGDRPRQARWPVISPPRGGGRAAARWGCVLAGCFRSAHGGKRLWRRSGAARLRRVNRDGGSRRACSDKPRRGICRTLRGYRRYAAGGYAGSRHDTRTGYSSNLPGVYAPGNRPRLLRAMLPAAFTAV